MIEQTVLSQICYTCPEFDISTLKSMDNAFLKQYETLEQRDLVLETFKAV